MKLTIILTGFFLLLANVALLWYVKHRFSVGLRSYFAARGDHPSEFASLVGIILDQSAAKNAQSLKSVFMGQNSVSAKNAGRLDQAITTDIIGQQSPLLGMGMSMFPNLNKLITKNPGALEMLASFMKGQGNVDGGTTQERFSPGNGESNTPTLFSL